MHRTLQGVYASLILIGGSNASGAASASVLSFDIDHKQWVVLQPMPEPREASMAVFFCNRGVASACVVAGTTAASSVSKLSPLLCCCRLGLVQ